MIQVVKSRPVARGCEGTAHPPNLPKGPLCECGFSRRVEGGGEVQKVHFLSPNGPLLGFCTSPDSILATAWPGRPGQKSGLPYC